MFGAACIANGHKIIHCHFYHPTILAWWSFESVPFIGIPIQHISSISIFLQNDLLRWMIFLEKKHGMFYDAKKLWCVSDKINNYKVHTQSFECVLTCIFGQLSMKTQSSFWTKSFTVRSPNHFFQKHVFPHETQMVLNIHHKTDVPFNAVFTHCLLPSANLSSLQNYAV